MCDREQREAVNLSYEACIQLGMPPCKLRVEPDLINQLNVVMACRRRGQGITVLYDRGDAALNVVLSFYYNSETGFIEMLRHACIEAKRHFEYHGNADLHCTHPVGDSYDERTWQWHICGGATTTSMRIVAASGVVVHQSVIAHQPYYADVHRGILAWRVVEHADGTLQKRPLTCDK